MKSQTPSACDFVTQDFNHTTAQDVKERSVPKPSSARSAGWRGLPCKISPSLPTPRPITSIPEGIKPSHCQIWDETVFPLRVWTLFGFCWYAIVYARRKRFVHSRKQLQSLHFFPQTCQVGLFCCSEIKTPDVKVGEGLSLKDACILISTMWTTKYTEYILRDMYGNTGACISEASHYVGVTFPIVDKNWETEEHKTLDCVQETGEFWASVCL